jgi:8-oxo-dGTP diphosphatase
VPDAEHGASPARAGLVPWRRDTDGRLLVGLRGREGGSSLPSDRVDGRHPLAAALGAVDPETRLGPPGPRREVAGGTGSPGGWYWPVEVLGGQAAFDWRPPDSLADEAEHEVVSAATERLAVRQVVLVRHAHAGQRAQWDGPDAERPLDALGQAQARALAGLLAAYGVQRVHSSDSRRCLETIGPLGGALGLPVLADHLLSEDGSAADPAAAARVVADLVAQPGQAVVCTQRKTLSRVLPGLLPRLGLEPDAVRVPRKGGLLVLHLGDASTEALSAEALGPPPV